MKTTKRENTFIDVGNLILNNKEGEPMIQKITERAKAIMEVIIGSLFILCIGFTPLFIAIVFNTCIIWPVLTMVELIALYILGK